MPKFYFRNIFIVILFLFILLVMAYFFGLKIDFYKGAIIGAGVIASNVFLLWCLKNKRWIMNNIRAKLKSKWALFFAIIYAIFLVENLMHIINYDDYMKSLIGKSQAYKFGTLSALFLKPIFDLSVLYIIFFKDTLLTPKSDKLS